MDIYTVQLAASPTPIAFPLPTLNIPAIGVRLLTLLPLIGGYLMAREGKGNLLWETLGVVLLVLATVVPPIVTQDSVQGIFVDLLNRLPIAVLLLGIAFMRDGGAKMIVGIAMMVVAFLLLLPRG
jgi:hypothetical protein